MWFTMSPPSLRQLLSGNNCNGLASARKSWFIQASGHFLFRERRKAMRNDVFLNKINEIRRALDLELYNCALSLALTLPDICGKVESPTESSNKRYKLWFDKYAKHLFTSPTTKLPENVTIDYIIFTAEECWALRCALLHAGNYDVKKTTLSKIDLHAHKKGKDNYSHILRDSHYADFDVIFICEKLCNAAEQYYMESNNKTNFSNDEIRIDTW